MSVQVPTYQIFGGKYMVEYKVFNDVYYFLNNDWYNKAEYLYIEDLAIAI